MSICQKIKVNIGNYSAGQRKIANYILEHEEDVAKLSSQELANHIGVSQSSIIKFIQILGIDGFTQFKMQLASSISRTKLTQTLLSPLHNKIERKDSLQVIADKLQAEKQQALLETTSAIDFANLTKTIELINNANRIQIFGLGNSSLIAKDLSYKLLKLALPVINEIDAHVQLTITQSLSENDVLIIISYSGKNKEVLLAAQTAKDNGIKVIAITSLQQSKLREIADYVLDTIADETYWRSSSISSRTAQYTIIDLLFIGIVQLRGEEADKNIQNSTKLIKKLSEEG